jgi:uncharacterized protein YecE (DUF72 family)
MPDVSPQPAPGEAQPTLRVGCAMWAHRPWVGRWYPHGTRSGEELAAYATWCTAVEGNTTFYALPDPASVRRWAELTPPTFRFCCKLPRTITHDRRLRHAEGELAEACDRLAPLGERLGPTTVQLPASFGPDDLDVLAAFCSHLPGDRPWAVEVRHPAFFADDPTARRRLDELLARRGIDRVVLDSRALFSRPPVTPADVEAHGRKPRLPVRAVATGPTPIVRFIGCGDPDVDVTHWQPWVATVVRWLGQGRSPIVFLHTPDNLDAPALARRFHAEVARLVPGLVPLPDPLAPPEQVRLW